MSALFKKPTLPHGGTAGQVLAKASDGNFDTEWVDGGGGGTLAVTGGGTGTSTAFTAGSIVFAGSGGAYTQDNGKLFWDDTNNRLGVGTATPAYLIDLYDATNATFGISSDAAAALQVQRSQANANGANFNFRKTRGTVASPAAVASGDGLGSLRWLAYGGTNYRAIATVTATVDAYTSDSNISSYLSLATTPAGSITAVERFRIGPVGQLGIGGATYGNAGDVLVSGGSGAAPSWSAQSTLKSTESIIIACSDESTAITAGTGKVTFRMPYAFTLSAVRASVGTAPTGANLVIDINEGGTTILSTKLSIDAGEKTSTTAATAAVISDSSLADDAEITIDFDQVGSTVAGAGVKVYLIGTRT